MKTLAKILLVVASLCVSAQAFAAATLLPNGEQCFAATTGLSGMVGTLGTITAGSGGTAGTYGGIALTGGSGSGATANITVAGGVVTAVTVLNPGIQYVVGDTLSAASGNIGGVTGFSVPVASTSINSSLAGGRVYFYNPLTAIFKQTWFNPDQSAAHQNANPVALDANGCAVIYGTGSYRQVVQDSLGNTVWDQLTTDTSANNNTFWAGVAAGTPNVLTIVDAGFNATDGSIINFTANATNTGAATLNPSGYGAIPILKDTTNGPVALAGGEIVQQNTVSVIYRAVDNGFHLLNPPIQTASGSTAPLCGASGLVIRNNSVTPNTIADVSFVRAVAVSQVGTVINRSNAAFSINFLNIGVNGLDVGSFVGSTIYYIWLIDNGSAPAGLASLSATAPTLPTGYTYACRLSAIVANGVTHLVPFITRGNTTSVTNSLFSTSSVIGTCFSSYATIGSLAVLVPPTATYIIGTVFSGDTGGPVGIGYVASSSANVVTVSNATSTTSTIPFTVPVTTSQTVFGCNSNAVNSISVDGWVDGVNAN